uniref:Uncharacterized protein n=1 Tax=Anguilla anguilla TaxID=7936 RepID=A0A0E9RQ61_ANGAN
MPFSSNISFHCSLQISPSLGTSKLLTAKCHWLLHTFSKFNIPLT